MLKTLTFLFSVIISIFFAECKSAKKPKTNVSIKEFEGIITYHEIERNYDNGINLDDTVQFFYSNGNFVKIHSAKSAQLH